MAVAAYSMVRLYKKSFLSQVVSTSTFCALTAITTSFSAARMAAAIVERSDDCANAIRATVEHMRAVIRGKRIDRATLELLATDLDNVADAISPTSREQARSGR